MSIERAAYRRTVSYFTTRESNNYRFDSVVIGSLLRDTAFISKTLITCAAISRKAKSWPLATSREITNVAN